MWRQSRIKLEQEQRGASMALTALHAFTGSDYTEALFHNGKKKSLILMLWDEKFTDEFRKMSSGQGVDTSVLENFVCRAWRMLKVLTQPEHLTQLEPPPRFHASDQNLPRFDMADFWFHY